MTMLRLVKVTLVPMFSLCDHHLVTLSMTPFRFLGSWFRRRKRNEVCEGQNFFSIVWLKGKYLNN